MSHSQCKVWSGTDFAGREDSAAGERILGQLCKNRQSERGRAAQLATVQHKPGCADGLLTGRSGCEGRSVEEAAGFDRRTGPAAGEECIRTAAVEVSYCCWFCGGGAGASPCGGAGGFGRWMSRKPSRITSKFCSGRSASSSCPSPE